MNRLARAHPVRWMIAGGVGLLVLVVLMLRLALAAQPLAAAPEIYASPVHAGCYLAKPDRCKIHVEPITLNLASGQKLVQFRLVATRLSTSAQTTFYDFRPDLSNPVPYSGSTFSPSPVAKDFAATCGESYTVALLGRDTGDPNELVLGQTDQFTCPVGTYRLFLPLSRKN